MNILLLIIASSMLGLDDKDDVCAGDSSTTTLGSDKDNAAGMDMPGTCNTKVAAIAPAAVVNALCGPFGFVIVDVVMVWDIQHCHMGVALVVHMTEHNSKHTTDAFDADVATTRCCRMVLTCSLKLVCVANQSTSSKTMVWMCNAKDDDDENNDDDDCCFSKTCNKCLGLPPKCWLDSMVLPWVMYVHVNAVSLFLSLFDLHTRQQSPISNWNFHLHPLDHQQQLVAKLAALAMPTHASVSK